MTPLCDNCGRPKPDKVGLEWAEGNEAGNVGFCSLSCFVIFVRRRWIEAA